MHQPVDFILWAQREPKPAHGNGFGPVYQRLREPSSFYSARKTNSLLMKNTDGHRKKRIPAKANSLMRKPQ